MVGDTSDEKTPAVAHNEHAAAPVHEARKETYTVKITDSFQKIAKSHHITVAELKAANHIKNNTLHTGQKLVIPASKTEVAKGEKMHDSSIGKTASTASVSAAPASGAKNHHKYYVVAKGDTLKKIAKKFDVTSSAIEKANDLKGTKVAVGEKLRIPSHDVRSTDSVTRIVAAPPVVHTPAPVEPSPVQTQPAAVVQPEPTPMATPAPVPQPTPTPVSNPELANLTF
jgi:LysM repeat protein